MEEGAALCLSQRWGVLCSCPRAPVLRPSDTAGIRLPALRPLNLPPALLGLSLQLADGMVGLLSSHNPRATTV